MRGIGLLAGALACAMLAGCAVASGGPADTPPPVPPTAPQAQAVLRGKVIRREAGRLLVAETEGTGGVYALSEAALTPQGGEPDPGTLVEIGYDGTTQETFPLGIPNPAYLRVTGRESDLTGLYMQVFLELYARDEGLNDGISLLAVDLTEAGSLSEAEKTALLYLLQNGTGVEARPATFDGLVAEGLIVEEDGFYRFEKGLLLSLAVTEQGENSLAFTAEKWRSSLGAYFFTDCAAEREGLAWSYTIGAEAIS